MTQAPKASTGIDGLDEILGGGVPSGELHLIQGGPGTGKTTIGLQFLMAGAAEGEAVLYIALAQTQESLCKVASSHGWSLDGVQVQEIVGLDAIKGSSDQTLFNTADVELGETMTAIFQAIERFNPDRVVIDSIAQIRLLADTSLRYRRQLLTMREFFAKRDTTVLILDGLGEIDENAVADLSYGVVDLQRTTPEYGDVRRRLSIIKMRGMNFHGGNHNYRIVTGGLSVFPRVEPEGGSEHSVFEVLKSGVAGLDNLLGGGLEEGTACLLIGPTGTGKSSVATLYAYAAAKRGERAAIFCFDERPETFIMRSEGLGMDIRPLMEQGLITLRPISTAELSPGEFSQLVRAAVEDDHAKVVMMDSLTGYFHAMPQEEALISQMHDLLSFLSKRGVLSLLVVSQHGLIGEDIKGPLDVSYMSDAVVLLRHFEAGRSVRKAISVLKKRHGPHETTIRELNLHEGGISVGEPIKDFVGVLSGTPTFQGQVKR